MKWRHLRQGIPPLVVLGAMCAAGVMSASVSAQQAFRSDQTYLIHTWETEDGLPEDSATAMTQTPDGYLWFGTFNGLVRFDGVSFTVFDPANTPQLPSAEIINLHGDRSGRLWVSTSRGMAVRDAGQWRALGASGGWPSDDVRTFAERDNGDLLITTFHGEVYEFAGGRIAALPAPPGEPGKGYFGCVDDAGKWWVAQHRFVGLWDGQRWTSMVAMTARNPELVGCAQARGGGIWLLIEKSLRKFQRGAEVSRITLPELPGGLWSMAEDSHGNVWVASYGEGVNRISRDGRMRRWTTTNGLVSASTRFVFEDREDNLWIGTSGGGLTRLKPRRIQSFGAESGLIERVVSSIWPGRDGSLWIATRGKGLFRLRNGVVTPVPPPIPKKVMIAQSVLSDRQGRVWLGTGQDLWVADTDVFHKAFPDRLSAADIRALFEDSRGRLWIGAAKGTSVVDGERLLGFTAADGLPARGAYAFAEDSDGVIWLSTRDGVFRSEKDRFVELLDDKGRSIRNINCLKADADQALWLGSQDEGLIYRTQDGRLARVPGPSGSRSEWNSGGRGRRVLARVQPRRGARPGPGSSIGRGRQALQPRRAGIGPERRASRSGNRQRPAADQRARCQREVVVRHVEGRGDDRPGRIPAEYASAPGHGGTGGLSRAGRRRPMGSRSVWNSRFKALFVCPRAVTRSRCTTRP